MLEMYVTGSMLVQTHFPSIHRRDEFPSDQIRYLWRVPQEVLDEIYHIARDTWLHTWDDQM